MNCKEVRFYLYEYIHNELDEGIRTEIESHLLICENCMEEFEKTANILSIIPSISETSLPHDLRKSIIYKTINTPPFRFPIKGAVIAGAILIAGILSFFSLRTYFVSKMQIPKMDYYIIEGKDHNYIKPVKKQGGNIYYIPAGYDKEPF